MQTAMIACKDVMAEPTLQPAANPDARICCEECAPTVHCPLCPTHSCPIENKRLLKFNAWPDAPTYSCLKQTTSTGCQHHGQKFNLVHILVPPT
jgi:hypothetical protein